MAYVLETSTLTLGGTNYSAYVNKVELMVQVDEKDVTTFVGDGAKEVIGGQESGSLKITFIQDLTDNGLDETMWTALKARQPITFATTITEDAVSATNPSYSGYVLVNKWTPISGSPGDEAKVEVEFPTSGATTRATST